MAATDLLSIEEARRAVNTTSNQDDIELGLFVSGISNRIDDLCGPVVARTVTEEAHDGGKLYVVPRLQPVSSVTTVEEYDDTTGTELTAETLSSQPSDAYLLDDRLKFVTKILRRDSGSDSTFESGRLNVVVTYEAGRYDDTASVADKFKVCAAAVLRRLWKREQAIWAHSPTAYQETDQPVSSGFYKAVDPMVREFLADEIKGPPVA